MSLPASLSPQPLAQGPWTLEKHRRQKGLGLARPTSGNCRREPHPPAPHSATHPPPGSHHAGDASSCTRQERGGPGRGRVTPGPRVHPAANRRAQRPQPGFLRARHPRQKGEVAKVTRKPGGFFLQGPSLPPLPDSEFWVQIPALPPPSGTLGLYRASSLCLGQRCFSLVSPIPNKVLPGLFS